MSAASNFEQVTAASPVLVLLSGGVDSTACVHYYISRHYQVCALFVDYGQPQSAVEERAARDVCSHYRVPLRKLTINGPSVSDQYVRARNALLLTLALMHFDYKTGMIALGVHAGTPYVDCSDEFILEMGHIFSLYEGGAVTIDAPFLNWNKQEIWLYAQTNAVPLHLTHSSNPEDMRKINESAVAHSA
jgi:7-cyano-7-deazaguanine synthase